MVSRRSPDDTPPKRGFVKTMHCDFTVEQFRVFARTFCAVLAVLCWSATPCWAEFPQIVNTQNPADHPTTALEAAKLMSVPEGFHVSLFAGEPDVQQPIAFDIDDRGRLWVAECYTYAKPGFSDDLRDRVVILSDTNHDGHFDERQVFWDQGSRLTGLTLGFGGVWLLNNGKLIFFADQNQDDKPDGEPVVLLDGFDTQDVSHNIVSGLLWGPDGWLYGRHGIKATSHPGAPGAAPDDREQLNCGIWRFHPTRHVFEVVCRGTTNPWGLDYNDYGEMFFTNNVIGHLWHVVPGAHYQRMYGEDFNPHLYGLLEQTADHYHWDTGQKWSDSRDAAGVHGELGGGHSHCGGMIYLADNWPQEYRGSMFMCNTHGRRVNVNRLQRAGSGYVGLRAPDMIFANQPWFRGVELKYGPDGGVYLSDWTDIGECHDSDGVHRTSGRIYKIVYGQPAAPKPNLDLAKLSNQALVALQLHQNDWYVRRARRLLQERRLAGQDLAGVKTELLKIFDAHPDVTRRLRAMWVLYSIDAASEPWLQAQLDDQNEYVRTWAVRLLVDRGAPSPKATRRFAELARSDISGLVRLHLASALQRLPKKDRWPLASALAAHAHDAHDHSLPLMIWYGVEPAAVAFPEQALQLAEKTTIPLLRTYIARRIMSEWREQPDAARQVVAVLPKLHSPAQQLEVLNGMSAALQGWRRADPPTNWEAVARQLARSKDAHVREMTRELAVVFGDGRALAELRAIMADATVDPLTRRNALAVVVESRPHDLAPLLIQLVADRAIETAAVKSLASYDDAKIPRRLISYYKAVRPETRAAAIDTLVSRPHYAQALLQAVAKGRIPADDISAQHARQILAFGEPALCKELERVWGVIRSTDAAKKSLIAQLKTALSAEVLTQADPSQGRVLFNKTCATCHTLFGQGEKIGPDITGANRDNLDYLLGNIIDPSGAVAKQFMLSTILLEDGRLLSGVVVSQTGQTLALQTAKERVVLNRADIDEIKPSSLSLMPDGLLDKLSPADVRNLFAYLSTRRQVGLPPEEPAGK